MTMAGRDLLFLSHAYSRDVGSQTSFARKAGGDGERIERQLQRDVDAADDHHERRST